MQLSDIRTLSRYFATGDGSDSSFSDDDIDRQSNTNYRKLIAMSLKAVGDWNLNGRKKAQNNITAGAREISLPATFLRLKAVEIKYPSSAQDYQKATQIDQNKISPRGKDDYTTGRPEYNLYGSKMEIFVSAKTADIEAVTGGVNIYYEDEITALSDNADETILPEFANRLLCLLNAADYAMVNDHNKLKNLKREIGEVATDGQTATGEIGIFLNFLKGRSEDKRPRLRPRREDYGQSGLMGGDLPRSADWS